MRRFFCLAIVLMLGLGGQTVRAAKNPPPITKEQADDILNELRQIRQMLEKQGLRLGIMPEGGIKAKLNLAGYEMLGSKDAPLTVVEFTDYQCPFCQQFHKTTYVDLKKNYIDTGKVRFYSKDLPLDSIHPNAVRAAQAARCAAEQKQYWSLRELMSANPDKLDMENLANFAAGLRMDVGAFRACIDSGKYKNAVQTDVMEALKLGANGTPTFVVGKSTPEGVDGQLMVGVVSLPELDAKLKELGATK
jgi:protein-disulfide isomerase